MQKNARIAIEIIPIAGMLGLSSISKIIAATVTTTIEMLAMVIFIPCFSEDIGMLLTSSNERIIEATGMNQLLFNNVMTTVGILLMAQIWPKLTSEPIIIAFEGVGNPMKLFFCFSSILNFASLTAENTTIKSGIKERMLGCETLSL